VLSLLFLTIFGPKPYYCIFSNVGRSASALLLLDTCLNVYCLSLMLAFIIIRWLLTSNVLSVILCCVTTQHSMTDNTFDELHGLTATGASVKLSCFSLTASYCTCVNSVWMWYDFMQVMPVSHTDVLHEEAYMLFYVQHPKLTVRDILFSIAYVMFT